MLRSWFSISALLAFAVLMMAADSSQARQRRFGRRFRSYSDGYVVRDSQMGSPRTYYSETGPGRFRGDSEGYVSTEPGTPLRQSYYSPPDTAVSPTQASPVLLSLRVPANAEVLFDGAKTVQRGTLRHYISPPIEPGRDYTYEIAVKRQENGREVRQTRTITVHAGDRRTVDLTSPSKEKDTESR